MNDEYEITKIIEKGSDNFRNTYYQLYAQKQSCDFENMSLVDLINLRDFLIAYLDEEKGGQQ